MTTLGVIAKTDLRRPPPCLIDYASLAAAIFVPVARPGQCPASRTGGRLIVCLERPGWFRGARRHYRDFRQLCDADVIGLLEGFKIGSAQ